MTSNTQEILTQGELLTSLNDSEETLEDNQLDIEDEALLLTQAYNNIELPLH